MHDRTHPANAAMNVYRAADGTWFVLIVTPDKFAAVANAIGRSDLLTDPRFSDPAQLVANMPQLTAIFDEVFGAQAMAHWHSVFAGVNVTFGEVRGPQEVIDDPQLSGKRDRRSARRCGRQADLDDQQSDPGAWRHEGSGPARARPRRAYRGNPRRARLRRQEHREPARKRRCAESKGTRGLDRAETHRIRKHTMSDIITELSDGILRVELNRPAQKNAMTASMYTQPRRYLQGSRQGRDSPCRALAWRRRCILRRQRHRGFPQASARVRANPRRPA